MSYTFPKRQTRHGRHMSNTPSPLRHAFTVAEPPAADDPPPTPTRAINPLGPLRSSTMNRRASGERPSTAGSHKRGISETSPTRKENLDYHYRDNRTSSPRLDEHPPVKSLSDTPSVSLQPTPISTPEPALRHSRSISRPDQREMAVPSTNTSARTKQDYSVGIGRSDSRRAPAHNHASKRSVNEGSNTPAQPLLDSAELAQLGHSSSSKLRDLSKLSAQQEKGFAITSPEQEVAGLHGRRRLQKDRINSKPPGYGGRIWMDQQRQFLQAYEYLCHIGEAKDWIEDVIGKDLPPIVQLEETLRDGVTLAEVVQKFHPEKQMRIFHNPRLQFRHSDNIAIFFRFLAEVELPDLFRFELVDLYEKKNIPKVIYCIHALSWLLLKKGMVDFRIGNLVGQLQFEDHELEATQKGLDKAGISMPNFSGMSDTFGAAPEPEPEPQESEEERVDRELHEAKSSIVEFQSQIRAALMRGRLSETMQWLWEHEPSLVDLQAQMRGFVARERSTYHLEMRKFAVQLQSRAKGFIVRHRAQQRQDLWKDQEAHVIKIQSLFRARQSRSATRQVRREVASSDRQIQSLQSLIRGALLRRKQDYQRALWEQNQKSIIAIQRLVRGQQARAETQHIKMHLQKQEHGVREFQALIRAAAVRSRHAQHQEDFKCQSTEILSLQSLIRGNRARLQAADTKESLQRHISEIQDLQTSVRGFLARTSQAQQMEQLSKHSTKIIALQALLRAGRTRKQHERTISDITTNVDMIIQLQSQARAAYIRNEVGITLENLQTHENAIIELQASILGYQQRQRYAAKKQYYEENVRKVIKAQSYIRARQQGEAYKTLTKGKDPPANTIKNFAHLLNDSDFDFEEEVGK